MIYSFYFEGGSMDGDVVLRDSAHTATALPQAGAWIDYTLGGIVGLNFPVIDEKLLVAIAPGESQAEGVEGPHQIYQVVYRDEIAGAVIVRCRYVPSVDLVPAGIKRIVFTFEGGLRDGATDTWTIVRGLGDSKSETARARYWSTDSGTVGKRFGAGSDAALEMLKVDGPDATRGTDSALHIYEVTSRTTDHEDLLLKCRFIRSECRAAK